MTKAQLRAWAAGFYEGEGYITAWIGSSGCQNWSLQIKNTDKWTLMRFQEAVGVEGRLYGPYHRDRGKPMYQLQYGRSDDIWKVITAIYDFLSPRRQEQILEVVGKREEYLAQRSRSRQPVSVLGKEL